MFGVSLLSPDVRLFLSLDNPKNAHINGDTEQFGADEADSLVFLIVVENMHKRHLPLKMFTEVLIIPYLLLVGVANGKIRDSPRRRDPS